MSFTSNQNLGYPPIQDEWRFCDKCHGMFFDGFPDKGVCPQGGGHHAAGFNFALPFGDPPHIG